MSTAKCINISQAKHLDPAVVAAVKDPNINQKDTVAIVEAHLVELNVERDQIIAKHEENKKEFRAQAISDSNPARYTNRKDTDDLNELNDAYKLLVSMAKDRGMSWLRRKYVLFFVRKLAAKAASPDSVRKIYTVP